MAMNKEVAELPSMLIQRWRAEAAAHEKRAEELSYGYPIFADRYEKKAEQKKECAAQLESALSASAEPVAWIRYLPDGLYEGPIHSSEFTEYFRKSGKWTPLHAHTPPPASCNPTTQPPTAVPDGAVDVRRPNCTSTEGVLVYFDSAEAADRYFSDLDGVLSQPAVASAPSSLQGFGPMPSADLSGLTIRPTTPEPRT